MIKNDCTFWAWLICHHPDKDSYLSYSRALCHWNSLTSWSSPSAMKVSNLSPIFLKFLQTSCLHDLQQITMYAQTSQTHCKDNRGTIVFIQACLLQHDWPQFRNSFPPQFTTYSQTISEALIKNKRPVTTVKKKKIPKHTWLKLLHTKYICILIDTPILTAYS